MKKHQHYSVFSSELNRHNIPGCCSGAVLYSYWVAEDDGYVHTRRIDIDRLRRDLESGDILKRKNFGKKNVEVLREAFGLVATK